MRLLTKQEISDYKTSGYILHKEQLYSEEKMKQLTEIFEEHLANKGEKRSDELDLPHFKDSRLLDFLLADEPLKLVESLIGPNIGLFTSHFIAKEAYTGRRTPWHEDSAYWKGKFDRLDKVVTIWLAIDDSTKENGCMGVIPGTHINGFSNYVNIEGEDATFNTEVNKESFNEEEAVWFELKKGECSLHDARIIHGAGPNKSPNRRCGYTMRYFSLDMKFDETNPENKNFKLWHAKGENLADNKLIYT